ncbi:MAG: hypothetical protein GX898_03650 [Corynebacterium sp.]|uniref:hypothetical protein n=1 Tax=uncultured Corynebacterium sp. TaxID=159447 RepID=UPI0017EE5476|nr:hypothetical protein [uncultured Corynebacterium sp.]NLZ57391.1 hypothetical protein [Corynebacterium sp.]
MTRSKFITGATAASIFAATFSVLPTAGAVHFHEEQRNDRSICVSMSTDSERQITRDHYRAQLREYEVLQADLRMEFPEFSQHYVDFDRWISQGYATNDSRFYDGLTAIKRRSGFTLYEVSFFAVKGTDAYRELTHFTEEGFSLEMEFAPEWSKAEMKNYPESDVPVIPVGADWTVQETSSKTVGAYTQLTTGLPIGAFNVRESSVPNLIEFLEPRKAALAESRKKYDAVISPAAILRAAQNCHTLFLTGELSTITETPKETATVPTVTETPEPVPPTTSVAIPTETVMETPVTTTVTEPAVTVTETPSTTTAKAPSPEAEGSSMGLMAGIIAALAAIGGIAVFMANNLGLLQAFF